jgi:hypothetical protein
VTRYSRLASTSRASERNTRPLVQRNAALYTIGRRRVIETIKHKGLRRLYEENDRSGVRADLVEKLQKILSALEAAIGPEEMACPRFGFTP